MCTNISRPRVSLKEFNPRSPPTELAKFTACLSRLDLLISHRAEELSDPQTASVSCRVLCGQNVIRAYTLSATMLVSVVFKRDSTLLTLSP